MATAVISNRQHYKLYVKLLRPVAVALPSWMADHLLSNGVHSRFRRSIRFPVKVSAQWNHTVYSSNYIEGDSFEEKKDKLSHVANITCYKRSDATKFRIGWLSLTVNNGVICNKIVVVARDTYALQLCLTLSTTRSARELPCDIPNSWSLSAGHQSQVQLRCWVYSVGCGSARMPSRRTMVA